jgi:Ino eighty subunit 1
LRRSGRRLDRWYGHEDELGIIAPVKKARPASEHKAEGENDDMLDQDMSMLPESKLNGDANGDITMNDADVDEGDQTALMDEGETALMDDGETALMEEDDGDDADRTDIMGASDVE